MAASVVSRTFLPHFRRAALSGIPSLGSVQFSSRASSYRSLRSPLIAKASNIRFHSTATAAVSATDEQLVERIRPEEIVAPELNHLKQHINLLLSSRFPGLDTVAKYYLKSNGKLFRPMVVFLMSRATAEAPKIDGWRESRAALETSFNKPIAPPGVHHDLNPDLSLLSSKSMPCDILGAAGEPVQVLGTQRRLAEIVELIHTASLLHDDVIDHAETRRGMPSANVFSGNKLSILVGDFMLGRASVYLARLRYGEVTELMAEVIAELVQGEILQLQNTPAKCDSPDYLKKSLDYYLEKTYLKSASLIAKSCRATALLGGATPEVADAAYSYGKHLGLAFQLIDDVLDYTGSNEEIGKPANADLKLGLATAPVFYASEEFPELGPMIDRQFTEPGDAAKARELVYKSRGIQRSRDLALSFCDTARQAISIFPDTKARAGLEEVLNIVLTRKK
ncbi:coq1 putative hexaprenyl diphosphate synthase [Rhizina undulata]